MKRIAICPGTFDPITNGHIDIVMRSLSIFDEIVVAVAPNPRKTPLFNIEERIELIGESFRDLRRVTIESFDGLLVNYVKQKGGVAIVRGLRAISDFRDRDGLHDAE